MRNSKMVKENELNECKKEFMNNLDQILSKKGILSGKDLSVLICVTSSLDDCSFLSETEKMDVKLKLEEKVSKNNELINNVSIKIKAPEVKNAKKVNIKNKVTCVIAKGKESTINSIKDKFSKLSSIKISDARNIYQEFCDFKKKKIQKQLDYAFEKINDTIDEIKKMNDLCVNESDKLTQKLEELEIDFEKQNELNKSHVVL